MAESRRFDLETLYGLLPSVYRVRDAMQGEPLKQLMGVIAAEVAVLEEDLAQLYDDQFIETSADWVVPYIGDLIGTRGLQEEQIRLRAQVANTLAYRRRKGTAAVLEQLARDVTGWDARVVEFFRYLAVTQHLGHLRPAARTVDLRKRKLGDAQQAQHERQPLVWQNTPFETWQHTADVRNVASGRGGHNLPNVGIFLWRLRPYSWRNVVPAQVDARRFMFNPLGIDTQLFSLPVSEETITHLAEPENVSLPLSREALDAYLDDFYGPNKSLSVAVNGDAVPPSGVVVCNLADSGPGWAHHPADKIGIDPVLGRLIFPSSEAPPDPDEVRVSFYYGFMADIGGGEYARAAAGEADVEAPATVVGGLAALGSQSGVIELDGETFSETLPTLSLAAGQQVILRAEDRKRATLLLGSDWVIEGGNGAELVLDGLLISGGAITVRGDITAVTISHCTLVPGIDLERDGTPQQTAPSLTIEAAGAQVTISDSILGGIRAHVDAQVSLENCLLDATEPGLEAYAGLSGGQAGGQLQTESCTIIGKVHTAQIEQASNTIFEATLVTGDGWEAPVWADQCQEGCVRFSHLPINSRAPRRFRCVPVEAAEAGRVRPAFTARRYGQPGYGQLEAHCPAEIAQGAEDESEMGVFHDIYGPQRLRNLRFRLDEYLRFGLEAGIFFAT